ncbi:MAG: hypothetical protein M1817_005055 [Caeruleum heppii]|nr:MAG: hypothetical protein M1817_005055 [Caeruleum heppii]
MLHRIPNASCQVSIDGKNVQKVALFELPAFRDLDFRTFPGIFSSDLRPLKQCIGYTKQQRRCRNSTGAGACAAQMIEDLRDSKNITIDDLEQVAERLLCRRWHFEFIKDIAELWFLQLQAERIAATKRASSKLCRPPTTTSVDSPPRSNQAKLRSALLPSIPPSLDYHSRSGVSRPEPPFNPTSDPVVKVEEVKVKLEESITKVEEVKAKLEESIVKVEEIKVEAEEPEAKVKEPIVKLEDPNTKVEEPPVDLKEPAVKIEEVSGDGQRASLSHKHRQANDILYQRAISRLAVPVRTASASCSPLCLAYPKQSHQQDLAKAEFALTCLVKLRLPEEADTIYQELADVVTSILRRQSHQAIVLKNLLVLARYSCSTLMTGTAERSSPQLTQEALTVLNEWISFLVGKVQSEIPLRHRDCRKVDAHSFDKGLIPKADSKVPKVPRRNAHSDESGRSMGRVTEDGFKANYPVKRIQRLVPYHPRFRQGWVVSDLIRAAMTKDFVKLDEQTGQLYGFFSFSNQANIKIGHTTRSVLTRLREWEKKCGYSTSLVYPQVADPQEPMPHVYRVEKLIQAELAHYRGLEKGCPGCLGNHTEWFTAPMQHIAAVVKKWVNWIKQEPYEQVADDSQSQGSGHVVRMRWRLKRKYQKDLESLCMPLRLFDKVEEESVGAPLIISENESHKANRLEGHHTS